MRSTISSLVGDPPARLFAGALALYVVVLPLSGTAALRSLAFVLMIGATLWALAGRRLALRLPLWPAWAAYAAVAVASLLYAVDPAYSAGEIKAEIVYEAAVFAMAAAWVRGERQLAALAGLLAAANGLFVLGSAVNLFRLPMTASGIGAWETGVGATSTAIVTALPWVVVLATRCYADGRRGPAAALAALAAANLGALFLTMNRQGWLALAGALGLAALLAGRGFWSRRRLAVAAAFALLFAALVAFQFHLRSRGMVAGADAGRTAVETTAAAVNHDARWQLWRFSLERIAERPLTGGGFGREAFDLLYRDYHLQSGSPLWHAHNMVLNKGIQMGLPGMAAFLALWLALAAACARGLRAAALRPWAIAALAMMAGVFLRNMADDFFVRDQALMFWLLCGAFLGALRQAPPDPEKAA